MPALRRSRNSVRIQRSRGFVRSLVPSCYAVFGSLFGGFISLFGHVGNCFWTLRNINHLPTQGGSLNSLGPRFSQYLPVEQGPDPEAMLRPIDSGRGQD